MRIYRVLILMMVVACQPKSDGTVEQVPEDKIVKMLADFALADGAVSPLSGYMRDSLVHVYYNQIYELNGMTLEEYDKHLHTLAKDTKRLEGIVKQAEMLLKERQKQDSIQRATSTPITQPAADTNQVKPPQ